MQQGNEKSNPLISFLKYHNAVPLVVIFVFLGASATLAASPVARDAISDAVIQKKETVISIDNSRIVSANLENFNPTLQIKEVTEDDEKYYVRYAFTNITLKDYVWQDSAEERVLSIAKAELSGKDLGLRVAKELGEVLDYESGFLKEVQAKEKKKGATKKVATVEYAGLVGKFLDPEQKEFEGYAPIVPEPEATAEAVTSQGEQSSSVVVTTPLPPTRDEIRAFVADEVARLLNEALATRNASVTTPSSQQEQIVSVVSESQISTTTDTTTSTATTTDSTTVITTTDTTSITTDSTTTPTTTSTTDTTTSTTTDSTTTSTTTTDTATTTESTTP